MKQGPNITYFDAAAKAPRTAVNISPYAFNWNVESQS